MVFFLEFFAFDQERKCKGSASPLTPLSLESEMSRLNISLPTQQEKPKTTPPFRKHTISNKFAGYLGNELFEWASMVFFCFLIYS